MRDWENVFQTWSTGPSTTEEQRIQNAERQIKDAIRQSNNLRNRNIKVFVQGSYRNNVNVRQNSDVDIGVLCFDTFFYEFKDDNVKTLAKRHINDAEYSYATFKNDLHNALVSRFGGNGVTPGNKAFKVNENTYRVEADVAAFFEHRRYISEFKYLSGVEMAPSNNNPPRIINWPEQHYENGVQKNTNTHRYYKKAVRILKCLKYEMADAGIQSAQDTPSFLVECLTWNVSNKIFSQPSYKAMVRAVLAELYNSTMSDAQCTNWGEVSELKYLFRPSQPWTRAGAHKFLSDAWDYIGYK